MNLAMLADLKIKRLFTAIVGLSLTAAAFAAQPDPGTIVTRPLPLGALPTWIDASENIYSTNGTRDAADATPGAAQTQPGGGSCSLAPFSPLVPCEDAIIVKVDASGKKVFATLLGGPAEDYGTAVTADAAGNVYVVGQTYSSAFPTTPNAAIPQSTTNHRTFAAKLNPTGTAFVYVTYLPDDMWVASSIVADAAGNAYIIGQTASPHPYVVKLNSDGSTVLYTQVLTASNADFVYAATVDAAGDLFLAGRAASPDFPVTPGVVQSNLRGTTDGFLTKLDPSGNIAFSTLLGGSGADQAISVALDRDGNIYTSVLTTSFDLPTTPGTYQPAPLVPLWNNSPGGYVAKLSPDASSIQYASYLPMAPLLAVGNQGDVFLAGGAGANIATTASAPQPCASPGDSLLLHLDSHGALLDSTYVRESTYARMLTVGSDGSALLAASQFSKIHFGDGNTPAPACMGQGPVNAAAPLGQGYLSPGEFVSFFGFGIGPEQGVSAELSATGTPTTLGGVRVKFDGVPAPILYAQSRQVNAQVPFEVADRSATAVTLEYGGRTFGPFTLSVQFGVPGLFRLQPNVSAQAFAVNDDGTFNGPSNPALRGSFVMLLGTGFGPTIPGCTTGGSNVYGPASLAPDMSVTILGVGTADYAGSAPGLACGITQINVKVPLSATPGALLLTPELVKTQPVGGNMSVDGPGVSSSIIYVK